MIKTLIFDFDGLILDTEAPEYVSWCEIYADHGVELSAEAWAAAIGTVGSFDPYRNLEELTGRAIDPEAIRSKRRPRNQELILRESIRPGLGPLIEEARSLGLRLAIASTSPTSWVVPHLERLGLVDRFEFIGCREMVARPKPFPDVYSFVLEQLGIAAEQAVAFEDSPNGIAAAKGAGLFCVAVPCDLTKSLDHSRADLVADSLETISVRTLAARLQFLKRGA